MKLKILALILTLMSLSLLFVLPASAGMNIELPIDVEERYTDIEYEQEDVTNIYGEIIDEEVQKELETKKTVYIIVLVVLLIISIVILVVTIKRAKAEKDAIEK